MTDINYNFPCDNCRYYQRSTQHFYCSRRGKALTFWDDLRIAIFGCREKRMV